MKTFLVFLVLCLVALASVQAQRREKKERVPISFRGDVCDKVCSKRDGWDKCEKEKKRGDWEVTCTDTSSGRGGKGGKFGGRDDRHH